MPPYRVRLSPECERQIASWKGEVPDSIIRDLMFRLVDDLEHQSAFSKLRAIPGGHLIAVDIEPFEFVVFVTHRDETFFVHHAVYTRD